MIFNSFGRDARAVVEGAAEIARDLGAPAIEAEHLLLALARRSDAPAALADVELDYDGVLRALEAEQEASLAAVGVAAAAFELPPPRPAARPPRWGASAKLALQRAARIAEGRRDRQLVPGHLLLAVLRAPAGTVPRALRLAGVDPVALGGRVEADL